MAMVLDAFASYVQNMLTQMVSEEVHMLLGVGDDIQKMDVKLRDLNNFLAVADKRNITEETVREWVAQLKRAMYEATDILDLCQLKAMGQGPSTVDVGCFNPLLFCMRNPAHAHDIGTRVKALNKRLDTIKERSTTFSFINLSSYEDPGSKVRGSHFGNPRGETSGEFDRLGVVGEKIKEDTRALVEILLTEKESNNNIMVVAIVGVGGIGKTTLAKKVFNDETMKAHFDKTIWLSVNQDFDKAELLRTIITLAGGVHGGEKALAVLQPIITAALTGKKLLLVLDDVWNHIAWGDVLEALLANIVTQGSRVLVTTRDERIARRMKAVLPYHHVDKLMEDDAWSLLKKQIVSSEIDAHDIDILKDIGLQIVAKCDGLPLAVKVMGGLLCQKDNQYRDWKMVLDNSIWSESGMPEELNHAVYLSYRDLSSPVKQCFLHYSLLPKTAIFLRDEIIGMWISEGFLHGTSRDLEELGSEYYKELIVRNLIEPNEKYVDQRVCNMHDVVRSFAQFVSRDEALAAHSGEANIVYKLSAQKFLRISIESNESESESDGLQWSSLQAQTTLRTLISVGHINMKPGDSLVHFPCLRTLHANSARAVALLESLHEFKHLRYLSLEQSDISSLPESIGKMKFLQYISFEGCQQFVELPRSIVNLGQLRHLNFNKTSINGIPRGFCALTNLRILNGFLAYVDGDWCSLEELGPLSQLKNLDIQGLENVTISSSATKAMLGEKLYLTRLSLTCGSSLGDDGAAKKEDSVSKDKQKIIEKVFYELCPPPNLYYLSIKGYIGLGLPRWMMSSSDATLKILRILMIEELACCTQLPDGLSQLPCLEIIQIDRAPAIKCIGPEFLQPYHHNHPCPSQAVVAFPRLHQLILYGLVEWEEWEWEEQFQAFPVLHELRIQQCKLWCLPPGLASQARALSVLYLENVQGLIYVENFQSLIELDVIGNLNLERITNVPRLQKLTIISCPELKELEVVPALRRLVLEDYEMKTLLKYIGSINPSHLELYCSLALLSFISLGQAGPEWYKFSHVEHVKAYAREQDNLRKWYVLCTNIPYKLETNVILSAFMPRGILSSSEDTQRFKSVFKMRRKTFSYICSLVKESSLEDMNNYNFIDGRVLSLEDRVAVALRRLNSSEPTKTIGYSVGVNESTVLLVTERFTHAVCKQDSNRLRSVGKVDLNLKILRRLKETWKYLQVDFHPESKAHMIYACSILNDIAMYMEDGAALPNLEKPDFYQQVRQVANEDAIRARDMMSQYFLTSSSSELGGTLSSVEDTQTFVTIFKMTKKTFSYICSLVKETSLKDMSSHTFVDGMVLSLEDKVAIGLRRLYSSEPSDSLGSFIGVNESTINLVTESFVAAVCEQALHHLRWPDSCKMAKIKSMFDKIYNMNNCCGVISTAQIPFGPNYNHETNFSFVTQVVVDPEIRFMTCLLTTESIMNRSSILHNSWLFKRCEEGYLLNGNKQKVALDGSEVGEYIIGDAEYPLLPWLLTPYQEEDLSDSKAEFNRRHSAATTIAAKALARFKDTWKYLQGETWCPVNPDNINNVICACFALHNIVIDMEDDAGMQPCQALRKQITVRKCAS